MKLIVGLGNPGKEYEKTRHNIGFMALEVLSRQFTVDSHWRLEKRLEAEVGRGYITTCCEDVILAKPQTFMNHSGDVVKKLTVHYRLSSNDLLIIHDDLDLPLGTIRLSHGSGSAGHKGVQSIIDALHTKDFWRLRIGIGTTPKSLALSVKKLSFDASEFVLKPFARAEQPKLKKSLTAAVRAVQTMFEVGPACAQTEINAT